MLDGQIPAETTDESPLPEVESASLEVLVSPDVSSEDDPPPPLPPPPQEIKRKQKNNLIMRKRIFFIFSLLASIIVKVLLEFILTKIYVFKFL